MNEDKDENWKNFSHLKLRGARRTLHIEVPKTHQHKCISTFQVDPGENKRVFGHLRQTLVKTKPAWMCEADRGKTKVVLDVVGRPW